ncbi:hypothetical protein NC00_03500 [Xanthomonas cannabis pv. phaseoli]|uniref:TonB-dependent receptor plug domain-containing protein n=1 Tax=Xanthomonas cannabis pv. phaseoli TaxID=1885902 RepID=A0AB34PDA0_9XANT|nr:TonB-dependent receptor plug domain-containing protein [Xanthomonas cannabis]KGK59206.1 hypothetical protein NC00_03500 [Xanthomonas cannabis pv. phaseoli]
MLATGSHIGTRTVKNSSAPIDVVSAQELVATGQVNLLDALQRTLPSLSQVGGYQSDQESLVRGYQLRNLSPGYTLALVNGKRRNASAYVSGANGGGFPGHAWAIWRGLRVSIKKVWPRKLGQTDLELAVRSPPC